jgi:pimeloyl-ACP methyl ester carboxylesterase
VTGLWRAVPLLALIALTACGPAGPRPPGPGRVGSPSLDRPATPVPVGAGCLSPAERAGVTRFPSASGAELGGVVLGRGRAGVVLAHGQHGDVCEWLPYGRVLAGLGYHVLLFDFNGFGASGTAPDAPSRPHYDRDVAAAVGQLRTAGAERVAVVGAEIGGLAALIAAVDIAPPVAGVVDLSSPPDTSGIDGTDAVARLAVPALFVVSVEDPVRDAVRRLYAADRYPDRRLEEVPGYGHATGLLDAEPLRNLVGSYLRKWTG